MGDGDGSTLTTVPSSYLRYLPACYGKAGADGSAASNADPPFVALYLKIFEKVLSGIADGDDLTNAPSPPGPLNDVTAYRAGIRQLLDATVIGNLFYPRWSFLYANSSAAEFMPPLSEDANAETLFDTLANYFGLPPYDSDANGLSGVEVWARSFLQWLGGTIGLNVDKNWTIDASRTLIAQTFPLDRARGTPMGMTWLLNARLGARTAPVVGIALENVSVLDCMRPALIVCDEDTSAPPTFYVFDCYPDEECAVVISDLVGPEIDYNAADGSFDVNDAGLLSYVPWRFEVDVTLTVDAGVSSTDQRNAVFAYFRMLRSALVAAKPALTTYVVSFTLNQHSQEDEQRQRQRQKRIRYNVGVAGKIDMIEDI